jgi:hypothetical protein
MSAIQMPSWQEGFLAILPAVVKTAKIRFRRLAAEKREEAIQETIAAACVLYQLTAAQGKLDVVRPGPLADFAVRHVRSGRHVGGHQDGPRDVMSPVCQRRRGVQISSLTPGRDDEDGWREVTVEDRRVCPADRASFIVDFSTWVKSFTRRDRRMVNRLATGERTMEVADRFALTPGRISQLRRRFEREWHVFQGEQQTA